VPAQGKLVVVAPHFPPRRGGLENYAARIAHGLAARGWDVAVVTTNHERSARDVVHDGPLRVHRLAPWGRLSRTPVSPAWPGVLREILRAERPDVVHAHTPVAVVADLAVRLAGPAPTVLTWHGDVVKEEPALRLAWALYRRAIVDGTLRRATRIVATSERYAQASPSLRPHREKIEIIPPGVDAERFRPGPPAPLLAARFAGREIVLFVGQLDRSHAHKGVPVLLEALALVRRARPAAHLLLAGGGDALPELARRAARLGIASAVTLLGEVPEEDLPDLYRLAAVAALPSVNASEGFGMVLLEANAAGRPVVGTQVGGIPAAIEDGRTGLLVPPRDPAALAGALQRLLADPALAASLGARGRERAVREFSWDLQVERYARLLAGLRSAATAA
jgi:rhamnosyl/mannosyltransferase